MSQAPRHWKPLQPAYVHGPQPEAVIAEHMRYYKVTRDEAITALENYDNGCTYWRNDLYQVQVREYGETGVHINIRRIDGAPCIRDWRHFQQIKNEILGEECEAVELYPAESRKVDTSNKYHLFGYRDPAFRFPLGMWERDVDYNTTGGAAGLRQRSL